MEGGVWSRFRVDTVDRLLAKRLTVVLRSSDRSDPCGHATNGSVHRFYDMTTAPLSPNVRKLTAEVI